MMNKEEVRQYWRHQKRTTALKVICLSLVGAALLIAGCGETAEEIEANNAKSRAAVEAASANNNIKSTGSVIAKKVGGSATIILPDNQKLQRWAKRLGYKDVEDDEEKGANYEYNA